MERGDVGCVELRQELARIAPNISVGEMDELVEYAEEFIASNCGRSRFRDYLIYLREREAVTYAEMFGLLMAAVNLRCELAPGRIHA